MMYGYWDMELDRQKVLSFWTVFCPFKKHLKNILKTPEDIIIFSSVYHKWQSYDVWFLRHGAWWTESFVVLDRLLSFYPPNNPKNQNFEELKKTLEISSSYTTSVPKIMIICYTVPEIWHMTDVIVIFHVGTFFVLLPP